MRPTQRLVHPIRLAMRTLAICCRDARCSPSRSARSQRTGQDLSGKMAGFRSSTARTLTAGSPRSRDTTSATIWGYVSRRKWDSQGRL